MRIIVTISVCGLIVFSSVFAEEGENNRTRKIEVRGEGIGSSIVSPWESGDVAIQQDCSWWWLWGSNSYRWWGIPGFFITYESMGKSWTEYGTATESCGIPLIVDRIYVKVKEKPLTWTAPYTVYDKTAYNTNRVEARNSGVCGGCPLICGVETYHEAFKMGITWYVTVKSGCP